MKIKIIIPLLVFLFFTFEITKSTEAAISVHLFQVTSDGSQQSQPLVYKNLVVYTDFGGVQGIDIWGYDLKKQENFPIIEKSGQQFLTGLYKSLIVYEDVDDVTLDYDLRLYDIRKGEDTLVAGGAGAQTSGVTNGREVVYINGGACGTLHGYNIRKGTTYQIFDQACHPVRIWSNIVVFPVSDPSGTNIKGYDLRKKELFDIATEDGFQEVPNIYGHYVTWLQRTTGAHGDPNSIVMKNLRTGKDKTIYESTSDTLNWPTISNRYVVWSQSSSQHVGGVMAADLRTGEIFEVQEQGSHQNSHTMPAIWKDIAIWQAWRTGNGDIYGAEIKK